MVQIPTFDVQDGVDRLKLGEVAASNPVVADERYGAKADKYKVLSGIFDYAGKVYQERMDRMQKVQRIEAASTENLETSRYSQQVFKEAKALPDDQVLPYIQDKMQKRLDAMNEKYGDDPELMVDIGESIQRTSISLEDSGFTFVEARQKDRHLATLDQTIFDAKSQILSSDEVRRAQLYKQIDGAVDTAIGLGYLDQVKGADIKRNSRTESIEAIIRDATARGNTGYASAYLKANDEFLNPKVQSSLTVGIMNEVDRQQRQAQAAQMKSLTQELKMQKMWNKGGTQRSDVAVMQGVDPADKNGILNATGGSSIMTTQEAQSIKSSLESGEMSADQFLGLFANWSAHGERGVNAALNDLSSVKAVTGPLQIAATVASNPNLDVITKSRLTTDLIDMARTSESGTASRKGGIAKLFEETSGKKQKDAMEALLKNERFANYVSSLKSAGYGANDILNVTKQTNNLAMYLSNKGTADFNDALGDATSWVPDTYIKMDDSHGTVLSLPPTSTGVPLDPDTIKDELDRIASEISISDVLGDTMKKKHVIENGLLSWRKIPSSGDDRVMLVDNEGLPVVNAQTKRPIVYTFNAIQFEADKRAKKLETEKVKKRKAAEEAPLQPLL